MKALKFLPAFLALFMIAEALYACNCEPAPQLGAADWNDADLIFTATLLEHKMGMVGMLKFETQKTFKGETEPSFTFYFQPGKDHTLLHAVKNFNPGDEWIVFARRVVKENRVFYRLKETPTRTVCALSRPLLEEKEDDPYLPFLEDMAGNANGYRKIYDENGQLLAEGKYDNLIPVSRWAYYRPERQTRSFGDYVDGRREGEWLKVKERPDSEAQLLRKTIYKNGMVLETDDYRHTGEVSLRKVLTDSTETRYYFRYGGNLKSRITENFDAKTMHILNYSESGAIEEERFMEDQKVVRRYFYDENGERKEEGGR
ncbi:MAG: hypothetical protein KDD06_05225 [Phaeodactylibacter sp.]|nr:hypothetical protein [Phaeodactylibacter sp.]